MLHGRSQFTGKRRMCGGYSTYYAEQPNRQTNADFFYLVNNDDFISKYRLLKFGREKVLQNLGNNRPIPINPNSYL